jgi:hypothetical protein
MRTHMLWNVDTHMPRERLPMRPRRRVAHLGGGLVGERDGHDLPGRHVEVLHDVGDAVREHAGLARPGAGEDEQRPLRAQDGFALRFVKRVQV